MNKPKRGKPFGSAVTQALELFKQGMAAYSAAKQCGINVTTIYRHPEYKAMRDAKRRV